MSMRLAPFLLTLGLPLLACATSSPAPAPSAASRAGAAAAAPDSRPVTSRTICHSGARQAVFAKMGVPEDERPVDLAIAEPYVYVLFEPARLVRVKLPAGQESGLEIQMQIGRAKDEKWTSLDIDPRDGSLWIATNHFILRHAGTQGGGITAVPLQRVAGDGGFVRLLVAQDAIYATPTCAEDGVWRIDRQGKIVSSAFPFDPAQDAELARELPSSGPRAIARCAHALLMHGRGGTVLARDFAGTVHQADAEGRWQVVEDPIFQRHGGGLTGVHVGEASERWYFGGDHHLFYWKDRPAFLGSGTMNARIGDPRRPRSETVVVVPGAAGAGGFRELLEDCQGQNLVKVVTGPARYAALTRSRLIYGELATAPDLPAGP